MTLESVIIVLWKIRQVSITDLHCADSEMKEYLLFVLVFWCVCVVINKVTLWSTQYTFMNQRLNVGEINTSFSKETLRCIKYLLCAPPSLSRTVPQRGGGGGGTHTH